MLQAHNTKWSYSQIIKAIQAFGIESSPRDQKTMELLNGSISFEPMTVINRRGLNDNLAWLETFMMMGGVFSIDMIKEVAPNANHALYEFQSDYGPRIIDQLIEAQKSLWSDSFTRRAALNFNDRDQPLYDLACTTSIQYLNRNGKLYTTINMRSCDMVYGFPMDIRMLSFPSMVLAATLGLEAGTVTMNIGSMHLYEETQHKAIEVAPPMRCKLCRAEDYDRFEIKHLAEHSNQSLQHYIETDEAPFPVEWEQLPYECFGFSTPQIHSKPLGVMDA